MTKPSCDALMIAEHESILVLAGLFPWHCSVRTQKGEGVYRHITIKATLWSLDIAWGTKNERAFTDTQFRLRAIGIVRTAIMAMAAHHLEAQEGVAQRQVGRRAGQVRNKVTTLGEDHAQPGPPLR